MLIYIAGKVTGLPYKEAVRKFDKSYLHLNDAGHTPINPMDIVEKDASWDKAMTVLMPSLFTAEAIYLQTDWQQSKGAMIEAYIALTLGKMIIYEQF